MVNQTFGTQVFNTNYDPNMVTGWGNRPYVWSTGVSVQQELLSGVALNVGFYRNSWGNLSMVDNTLTSRVRLHAVQHHGPARSAAARGRRAGGQRPLRFEPEQGRPGAATSTSSRPTVGPEMVNNWQGVDVGVNARLKNGLTVQGGTSTGRRLTDACAVRALVPERTSSTAIVPAGGLLTSLTNPYCRVVEPYRTSATGLATYLIPKVDVQTSLTWQSNPGTGDCRELRRDECGDCGRAAAARPQSLGRRQCHGEPDRAGHAVWRAAQQLRHAPEQDPAVRLEAAHHVGRRLQPHERGYRSSTYNNSFVPGGAWLTPTRIASARYMKVGAQFDF